MSAARPSRRCAIMAKFLLCGLLSGVVVSHAVSAETASSRTEQGGNSYAAYIAEAAQRFGFPARWILAVMRRESAGDVRAVSEKGAMGLMQIMPSTARYIGQSGGPKIRHRNELFNAEQNLAMGGHYVRYLLNQTSPDGNLVEALVSYNAGPGNARNWRRRPGGDDPVLFLETLPSAETRHFAKTVLRNLWMYRSRLDQDAPSLDRMAEGRWPIYEALDSFDQADNGQTSTATGQ